MLRKIVISMVTASILVLGFSGAASAATDTYTVKKGDTLWGIGLQHKVSVGQLKSWNGLTSDLIIPNQVLTITNSNAAAPVNTTEKPQAPVQTANTEATANETTNDTTNETANKTITVTATAYTASCKGCSGITATGIDLIKNPNAKVISVDPNVIPLGSKVHVEGYGTAIAGDTGGAIKGNKIDLHVPTNQEALNWGVRTVKVTVYE